MNHRLPLALVSLSPLGRGSLFYLAFWASSGTLIPFMNVHFASLGLGGRQIGLLAALVPFMTLVFAPAVSALADRRRWRVRILQGLIVGAALNFFLIGYAHTFVALALLMAMLSLFLSSVIPITDSLIARMAARHSLNYGGMRLWGSIGFATMAIACGAVWQQVGFRPMFLVAGLMFLPVAWLANILDEGAARESHDRPSLAVLARDRGLVAILVASFLIGFSLGFAIIFEGVYMNYLGGSELFIGLLPGLAALSEPPAMHYCGHILRRLGGTRTLLLGYGLLGLAFLGFALAGTPEVLLIFAVIKGLGFGIFYVATVRQVTERTPEAWASTAQAALLAAMLGLGPLLAGPIGGAIFDGYGPAGVFMAGSAAAGLAALLLASAAAWGIFDRR